MKLPAFISIVCFGLFVTLVAQQQVVPLRRKVAAAGGGSSNCAAVTNNPTADTEVGTWTKEPSGAANYFGLVDDGRGVSGSDFMYKFDDGTEDTDTLRFEQPDGSCNITNIAITMMGESSAATPGVAFRVSQDNSTWTAWITNALAVTPAAEDAFNFGAVSWTAPTDIYIQMKTTTGNFDVARVYSLQALVNIAP